MGYYINPPDMSKEEFLKSFGRRLESAPTEHENEEGVAVCLVNNGPFTAAGIIFNANELEAFSDPQDYRPKIWYRVEEKHLAPYCGLYKEEPEP